MSLFQIAACNSMDKAALNPKRHKHKKQHVLCHKRVARRIHARAKQRRALTLTERDAVFPEVRMTGRFSVNSSI